MQRLALRKLRLRCSVFGVLIVEKFGVPLLGLAMEGVTLEIRIVLLLLKTARGIEALLVAGRDVTGNGFAFGNRFGAFEDDDVAWHKLGCVVGGRVS